MSTPDEALAAVLCTLPNTCIEHHHDAELAIAALAAQFVIVPRDATQTDGGPAQPGARPAVTTPPSVANPDEGFAIVRSDELAGLRAAPTEMLTAWDAYVEAHAGRHDGPHEPEPKLDGECGPCAGAQYGSEVTMHEYVVPALRAALEGVSR